MTKYLLNGELIAEANDRSDDEFELTNLRGKFLVELYNRVAETPVNKFSDNETAVRRTAAVLKEKIGMAKKTKSEGEKVVRTKYDRDARIYALVSENPIRESAKKTHPMFDIYLRHPGIKVGTALEKGVGVADLAYHLKKGWVELRTA